MRSQPWMWYCLVLIIQLIGTPTAKAQFPTLSIQNIQTVSPTDLQNCLDASSYAGDTVFVSGVVVAPSDSNTYAITSTGQGQLWLQSGNGPFSGLRVTQEELLSSNFLQPYAIGDSILISGIVDESTRDTQLKIYDSTMVTLLSTGAPLRIDSIEICDLNDSMSINQLPTGESWEGSYIQLNQVVVNQVNIFAGGTRVHFRVEDPVSGCQVHVIDRFLAMRTPIGSPPGSFAPFNIGTQLCHIRGVLEHYPNGCAGSSGLGGYVLYPTQPGDFNVMSPCGTGTSTEPAAPTITSISPNPSEGTFDIRLSILPEPGTLIFIMDHLGREIWRKVLSDQSMRINLPNLQNGIYWIRVKDSKGNYDTIKRLMIRRPGK